VKRSEDGLSPRNVGVRKTFMISDLIGD